MQFIKSLRTTSEYSTNSNNSKLAFYVQRIMMWALQQRWCFALIHNIILCKYKHFFAYIINDSLQSLQHMFAQFHCIKNKIKIFHGFYFHWKYLYIIVVPCFDGFLIISKVTRTLQSLHTGRNKEFRPTASLKIFTVFFI